MLFAFCCGISVAASDNFATQKPAPYETSINSNQDVDNNSLNFSSSDFGFKGPLKLNFQWSKLVGIYLVGKYTQLLDVRNALSAEVDAGGKQRRFSVTWGHALTPNQLIKLTAENLSQKLDFDFSSGMVSQWIYQNAIGASYAYVLDKGLLHDVNFNAYYSKANSKTLADKNYWSGGFLYRNHRRISGGTDKSISAGVDFVPTPTTLIGLQANYDNVLYRMYNDLSSKKDDNGLGATVSLDQLINDHVKFKLLASHRKPYQDYQAEVDWLLYSIPGSNLQLGLLGERIVGNLGARNDNQVGINLTYNWGGDQNAKPAMYGSPQANVGINNLRDWVSNPAVRMQQVLALVDQSSEILPSPVPSPGDKLSAVQHVVIVHPKEIKQIDVQQYFAGQVKDKDASKIEYTVKNLPKNHDLQYKDGRLIINADSFTAKDKNKNFTVDFVSANVNSIPSLSVISLVLVVTPKHDCNPYPNDNYYHGGGGVFMDLEVGHTYDHISPIKEDQTEDNQLMINPDPNVPGNDLRLYFGPGEHDKMKDLGLDYNIEKKPRKEGVNSYFIVTFSGTPKAMKGKNVALHTFHLYASNTAGGESKTPLPITIITDGATSPPIKIDDIGSRTVKWGDDLPPALLTNYFKVPKGSSEIDGWEIEAKSQDGKIDLKGLKQVEDYLGLTIKNNTLQGGLRSATEHSPYTIYIKAKNKEGTSIDKDGNPASTNLVLTVSRDPHSPNPYPNPYYVNHPITIFATAGQFYDKQSFTKESQTEVNQLMINPDPNVPGNDLNFDFDGLSELGLTDDVDAKVRSVGINHYFIIGFSGTPQLKDVGTHQITIHASNDQGRRSKDPLIITMIIGAKPTIKIPTLTFSYKKLVDIDVTQYIKSTPGYSLDEVNADLSEYGLTLNFDKAAQKTTITGTPVKTTETERTIVINATNRFGKTDSNFKLDILSPPIKLKDIGNKEAQVGANFPLISLGDYFEVPVGSSKISGWEVEAKSKDGKIDFKDLDQIKKYFGLFIEDDRLQGILKDVKSHAPYTFYISAKNDQGSSIDKDGNPAKVQMNLIVNAINKHHGPSCLPHANQYYVDHPIMILVTAGQFYNKKSFVQEAQTQDNQLMINPDPDMYDLSFHFEGLESLGLTDNEEAKARTTGGKYYIITFSGTPQPKDIGTHKIELYANNPAGRCKKPLIITMIIGAKPTITIPTLTFAYKKPVNKDITQYIKSTPGYSLDEVNADLSDYGLTLNFDKAKQKVTITGTPTKTTETERTIPISASNRFGQTDNNFKLDILSPPIKLKDIGNKEAQVGTNFPVISLGDYFEVPVGSSKISGWEMEAKSEDGEIDFKDLDQIKKYFGLFIEDGRLQGILKDVKSHSPYTFYISAKNDQGSSIDKDGNPAKAQMNLIVLAK